MKKILALVLTLAMMLTMLNIGLVVSAAGKQTYADAVSAEAAGWTVITDEAGFTAMTAGTKETPNKYMLMNDITLSARPSTEGLPSNIILDGNGYAIFPATNAGDKFYPNKPAEADTSVVTIQNITFGTAASPAALQTNGWNVAMFGGDNANTNMVWNNVDFYVNMSVQNNENIAGFMHTMNGKHTLNNCHMYFNQTNETYLNYQISPWIVSAGASANVSFTNCSANGAIKKDGRSGGFICTLSGVASFTNCVNNADLSYAWNNAPAADWRAGFVAYANTLAGATLTFENCTNYGNITAQSNGAAGIVGQVGDGSAAMTVNINNCKNYGNITAVKNFAGGIVANVPVTHNITNCVNYGTIQSWYAVGGIVGSAQTGLTITGCVNAGAVNNATERAGGILGRFTGSYAYIKLQDCVNLGAITKGNNGGGEIIGGMYVSEVTKINTCTNVFAFGSVNGESGIPFGEELAATDKVVTTGINQTNVDAANAANVCVDFMLEDDVVKIASPTLAGYQISVDGTSLRFLATINSLAYETVGFTYSVEVDGDFVIDEKTQTTNLVYEKINANVNGIVNEKTAASMGASYIYALTFINVPAEGYVAFTIQAIADDYTSAIYVVEFEDGAFVGYAVV